MEVGVPGVVNATLIGTGTSAAVYSATRSTMGDSVAIKILRHGLATVDERLNFDKEIAALQRLRDVPGIVGVLDSGVTPDGSPYLVMPLFERGSAQQLVERQGPLGWPDATRLVIDACDAVHRAHQLGIVHRDLKPANLLMARNGRAFVADFGIAKIRDSDLATTPGLTPSYAPPEAFDLSFGPTSDVYGLAATVVGLVTGKPPFTVGVPEQDTTSKVLYRVINEPPPDLRSHGCPADLADAVIAGMAKQSADRPQSASEFGRQLQAALDAAGATTSGVGTPIRGLQSPPSAAATSQDVPSPPGAETSQPAAATSQDIPSSAGQSPVVASAAATSQDVPGARAHIAPAAHTAAAASQEVPGPVSGDRTDRGLGTLAKVGLALLFVGTAVASFFVAQRLTAESPSDPATPAPTASQPTVDTAPETETAGAEDSADPTAVPDDRDVDGFVAQADPAIVGSGTAVADGTIGGDLLAGAWADIGSTSAWPTAGPTDEPSVVWQTDTPLSAAAVHVDASIVAGFESGHVRALHAATGAVVWEATVDTAPAAVAIADNTVIVAVGSTYQLLDLATGDGVGDIEAPAGVDGQAGFVTVYDSTVLGTWHRIGGLTRTTLVALDGATFAERWRAEFNGPRALAGIGIGTAGGEDGAGSGSGSGSSSSQGSDTVFIGKDGDVRALDATTGAEIWFRSAAGSLRHLAVGGGRVVASTDAGTEARDIATGALDWTNAQPGPAQFSISDSGLFIAAREAGADTSGSFSGNSMSAAGTGYAQIDAQRIAAVDLATDRRLWVAELVDQFHPTRPMLAGDGLLFVTDATGRLHAAG